MTVKAADSSSSAGGGSVARVAAGLGLAAVVLVCSNLLSGRAARRAAASPQDPDAERGGGDVFSWLWPPVLLALTAQGLRVWKAPRGVDRSRALGLWGAAEMLAAGWTAWGSRRPGGALTLAAAAFATGAAFLWRARRVETPDNPTATTLGWVGVAQALSREPRMGVHPTIH